MRASAGPGRAVKYESECERDESTMDNLNL